ncbi:hypothetical protein OQA88_1208 [Cercophora sp. LCS_1]
MMKHSFGAAALILFSTLTTAASTPSNLRYYPNTTVFDMVKTMQVDPDGAFMVGTDGVLRSFASDLSVVDYRQLDPEQFAHFADRQFEANKAMYGKVPESVTDLAALAETGLVDGRLVIDNDALLHPASKPNFSQRTDTSPAASSPLLARQPVSCGVSCGRIADCTPYGCYACYFQNGPPNGHCFDR